MKARHAVPGSPDSLQKSSAQPKDHLATNLYPRPNTQRLQVRTPFHDLEVWESAASPYALQ